MPCTVRHLRAVGQHPTCCGESEVCTIIWSPFRPLIRPCSLAVWANSSTLKIESATSDTTTTAEIFIALRCVINSLSPVCGFIHPDCIELGWTPASFLRRRRVEYRFGGASLHQPASRLWPLR